MVADCKNRLQKEIANDCRLQKALAKIDCIKPLQMIAKNDCKKKIANECKK